MNAVNRYYLLQHLKYVVVHGILPALFITGLCSVLYEICREKTVKQGLQSWRKKIKEALGFRLRWMLVFYGMVLLFATVFSREHVGDPLGHVFDNWTIYKNGLLQTPVVINLLMFIPVTIIALHLKINERALVFPGIMRAWNRRICGSVVSSLLSFPPGVTN